MSLEILFIYGLLLVAITLFSTEWISYDVTALLIASLLMVTGILTPEQGFSGFSNEATVTIAALFVLSSGLQETGGLTLVSEFFTRLGKRRFSLAIFLLLGTISVISAFINNTAAVAIFIPVVISLAEDLKTSPSKLLMPMSFAAMLGGVCTLIGTSTNILVSSIAENHDMPAFSMFEFLPLGAILLVIGFAYIFTIGIHLIPERRQQTELTAAYEMNEFLTDIVLEQGFTHLGKRLEDTPLAEDPDLDVLQIFPEGGGEVRQAESQRRLRAGDILRIRGGVREIRRFLRREDVTLLPTKRWYDIDLEQGPTALVEAVIAPDTAISQTDVRNLDVRERYGAVLLAIRHQGELQQKDLGKIRLSGGDALLLQVPQDRVIEVERDPGLVITSKVELPDYRRERMPVAVAVMAGVILTAALNLIPIVVGATLGSIVLIVTGCLTTEDAYQAINWKIIFLLAGVLPLGIAMEETGAAGQLSRFLLNVLGDYGPTAVLSGFFFLSMMLTNIMSNQATAVLLAPIAIGTSEALGVSARPLLMAVTFAASLSFMTPIGYQTNTLIYGPGQYQFTDFTKIGTPLNLIFWIVATVTIPIIWPF